MVLVIVQISKELHFEAGFLWLLKQRRLIFYVATWGQWINPKTTLKSYAEHCCIQSPIYKSSRYRAKLTFVWSHLMNKSPILSLLLGWFWSLPAPEGNMCTTILISQLLTLFICCLVLGRWHLVGLSELRMPELD